MRVYIVINIVVIQYDHFKRALKKEKKNVTNIRLGFLYFMKIAKNNLSTQLLITMTTSAASEPQHTPPPLVVKPSLVWERPR